MAQLWNCILGPKLYRIYASTQQLNEKESTIYIPNGSEKIGNNIVKGINLMWNIGLYTSPFIITYLYKKDYFCVMGCISLGRVNHRVSTVHQQHGQLITSAIPSVKFATGIGLLFVVGMIIRGLGRYTNPIYTNFLITLQEAKRNPSPSTKSALATYDSDFWAWPTDFSVKDVEGDESKPFTQVERSMSKGKTGPIWWGLRLPCNVAAFCCVHLFGRHLVYPGSIHLLQALMDNMLTDGREKLVVTHRGSRNKILTRDGNYIDTMFVDRRRSKNRMYGSTLVVCCEGNAGFYEVGLMSTPIDAGYSVLGWNHPGFAGSTGAPFPPQEQHAVDSVMQFAIHKLGFKPEQIIVYAWSIGGYAGTWAAMNYPQIRGLVLDACFDDLLPLAIPRMPGWMSGLVKLSIRQYMNLNVADQLCRYSGPVTLIRRTNDEIITTIEGKLSTNRGNDLLMKLLRYRYPILHDNAGSPETLRMWISEDQKIQEAIYNSWSIDEEMMLSQLMSFIDEYGETYPLSIGEDMEDDEKTKMLLYIARKILVNFNSTHNNPLETIYFKVPWTPMTDPSFVQL